MSSLNRVMLMGNLTRDPETKFLPSGTAVTDLGLAINRTYTQDGERKEETTFVDITVWGKQAENCGKFLRKGSGVFVEGRLQLDTWQDQQSGQNRSKLKVVGDRVQFLPSNTAANGDFRDHNAGAARAAGADITSSQPMTTHQLAQQHPAGQEFHRGGSHPGATATAAAGADIDGDEIPF